MASSKKKAAVSSVETGDKPFELWLVQITTTAKGKKTVEKLKKIRGVNITQTEADTLNMGIIDGKNDIAQMYFPSGTESGTVNESDIVAPSTDEVE